MRRWIGLVALLLIVVLLAAAGLALLRGIGGFLRDAAGGAPVAEDPMFEATEPPVTRPPGLTGDEELAPAREEDPSQNWVYRTLTPVNTVEPSA